MRCPLYSGPALKPDQLHFMLCAFSCLRSSSLPLFYLCKHHQSMDATLTETCSSSAFWEGSGELGRGLEGG